ncbi:MAG: radical SAM protein [Methanothrix sp.]|uniref:SPL family radical SAM protein n=1 Tax=Methanothrix sp. TaxID=90426 RepID=UPI0025F303A0|nr:radical SAM protein [Methanothrix sp.]MBK7387471.1 radical SAM protein [Methanothrix sp.]
MILRAFDPWKSELCTCPDKLSLNPYTGCPHGCLYCYASSYIPRFSSCRPKADLLRRLDREAARIGPGPSVAISNSSDPYPPMEEDLGLTRGCLRILMERDFRVQLVTKSDLVTRDIDILSGMGATVAITITTVDEGLSRRLEPGAPSPKRRLSALKKLSEAGIYVSSRIDPIIPGINDRKIEDLVIALSSAGVRHITSSTYKARPDSMKRIISAFPETGEELQGLYSQGEKISGSRYLPRNLRRGILAEVRAYAHKAGITFSTCREGFPDTEICCDGSHLLFR